VRYEVIFASYAEELHDSLPSEAKQALAGPLEVITRQQAADRLAFYRDPSGSGDWR
jgi:hypothetical protein